MGQRGLRISGRRRFVVCLAGMVLAVAALGSGQGAPIYASGLTVTNTNDAGPGSLRQAILDANAQPGLDFITFSIGSGSQTISLLSPLPGITDPAVLDATSQPGFAGSPLIELDGSGANGGPGLLITSGHSTVRGLVINRFAGDGIYLGSVGFDVVEGNFIGTSLSGTVALPNQGNGVVLAASTFGSRIGGAAPGERNVISGNRDKGVIMFGGSNGNAVVGNLIGTDVTGSLALGNRFWGVVIDNSSDNLIGGGTPGAGNVMSGSNIDGLAIIGPGSRFNVVQGNLIGTDLTGEHAIGNGQDGLLIVDASNNRIGGDTPGSRNVISGSGLDGVGIVGGTGTTGNIVEGNFIGTDAAGTSAIPNNLNGVTIGNVPGNIVGETDPGAGNLISGNLNSGVLIYGTSGTGNVVQGNLLGTDRTGEAALGNAWYGVVLDGAPGNTVGGDSPGARNVASGNHLHGILINQASASGNLVEGNFVGTDATGTQAVPNLSDGVVISSGSQNIIGGTTPATRNVISGNSFEGVLVANAPASGNVIQGNFIGTNAGGANPVPNGRNGITIDVGASQTTIGGASSGAGNVISGNGSLGVAIFGSASNAVRGNLIGLDVTGTVAMGNGIGVFIINSPNNLVGGAAPGDGNVIAGNAVSGINILGTGTTGTVVQGNLIGTDVTGRLARGNGTEGIFMFDTSQNLIGGPLAAARNVISANGRHGIAIVGTSSTANRVQGNYIGTDASGSAALGNGANGVAIAGVPGNVIGGTGSGDGNVISGNLASGVIISGSGASSNLVQGNLVGTDRTGSVALGNGTWGVTLDGASGNTVGGTTPAARNVMSGNRFDGMLIANSATGNLVQGNFVGTDASGTSPLPNGFNGVAVDGAAVQNTIGGTDSGAANRIAYNPVDGVVVRSGTGNAIRGNSIFSNGGLGIDLGDNGVTPNDRGDGDTGPNNLQNFPVIAHAVATSVQLVVVGSIDTQNPQAVTIEVFGNSVPVPGADPTGHGEGQTFLGSVTPNGAGRFTLSLPPVPKGTVISATATDSAGDTSEFALDVVAGP